MIYKVFGLVETGLRVTMCAQIMRAKKARRGPRWSYHYSRESVQDPEY